MDASEDRQDRIIPSSPTLDLPRKKSDSPSSTTLDPSFVNTFADSGLTFTDGNNSKKGSKKIALSALEHIVGVSSMHLINQTVLDV